eukprot:COSAG04_NODE_19542_length_413_cov_43.700637_1_plen_38_part_10
MSKTTVRHCHASAFVGTRIYSLPPTDQTSSGAPRAVLA